MNFKTIGTILSLLSLNLLVISSPLTEINNLNDNSVIGIANSKTNSKRRCIIKNNKVINKTDEDKVVLKNLIEEPEINSSIENSDEEINEVIGLKEENIFEIPDNNENIKLIKDFEIEEVTSAIYDNEEETYDINDPEEDENVCKTKECIEVSNDLLNSIDSSVDPCEDFYQFTCGNWMKNNPAIDDIIVKSFNKEYKNTENNVINIIEGNYKPNKNLSKKEQELDEALFKKLNGFYKNCLDLDKVNEDGLNTVINLIDKLKIRDNRDKLGDINELARIIAKIHDNKITENVLFNSDLSYGNDKKTKYISFSEGSFTAFENEEIEKVFSIIYENSSEKIDFKNVSELINDFNELVMFGKKIVYDDDDDDNDDDYDNGNDDNYNGVDEDVYNNAKINKIVNKYSGTKAQKEKLRSLLIKYAEEKNEEKEEKEEVELKEKGKSIITLKSLSEKYPNFNWKLYLEERFDQIGMKDIITDNTKIILYEEDYDDYFGRLNTLLGEVDSKTLSYYLEWYVIYSFVDYIPNIEKIIYFYKNDDIPRKNICYGYMNFFMGDVIGRYYVENYFSPNKKEYAEKLTEYIEQSMVKRIPEMEWLDDETIEYAFKKIASMNETVGYQDYIMNIESLYNKYEEMGINENEFLNNVINYYKYMNKENLKEITPGYENTMYSDFSTYTINAVYTFRSNSFYVPAGILQPPFFSSGIPDYINYGSIGSIIGHELTHAFDNYGKEFDMNGYYYNWWTDNDLEEYENLSKCFVDQYNEFRVYDNYRVDGKSTLNENLADNGGLARAYQSWKNSLMEDPETVKNQNQKLPGLTKYTPDQLFFISYGHLWCESLRYTDFDAVEFIYGSDEHSPGMARVNVVMNNSKDFAKAFNCPVNSKMNPKKKCTLW